MRAADFLYAGLWIVTIWVAMRIMEALRSWVKTGFQIYVDRTKAIANQGRG